MHGFQGCSVFQFGRTFPLYALCTVFTVKFVCSSATSQPPLFLLPLPWWFEKTAFAPGGHPCSDASRSDDVVDAFGFLLRRSYFHSTCNRTNPLRFGLGAHQAKWQLAGLCRGLPTSLNLSRGPCKTPYLSFIQQNIAAFFVFLWSQHFPPFCSKTKNCAFLFSKPGI